jgi:uncharacterized protein YbjT (DUF2867 family)
VEDKPVLVTGSTGYVGGRLVPLLLARGHRVRALGRSRAKLAARPWAGHPNLELAQGDVLDAGSLAAACRGARAAFYLVHSMNPSTTDFAAADRRAARHMAAAAGLAGLEQVIYLGGIVPAGQRPSHHLASRAQVAAVLAAGDTPLTWLRAAMILGAGSASFELMRYLVERLPVMLTPRWVRSRVQPIYIADVLDYLAGCLETPATRGRAYDIGGPDVLSYQELFQIYAAEAGLRRRLIIPVPVLTPRLSSLWIHLVTPVHASLARPLAEGLANTVVCGETRIRTLVPARLVGCRQAIRESLAGREAEAADTCWHDAGPVRPPQWTQAGDAPFAGGDLKECAWRAVVAASPERLWPVVAGLGGRAGWLHGRSLWWLRAAADKLAGGPGGRPRRHPRELRPGDAVGLWRVLEARPPHRLTLLAEMRAPGEAVMFWRLEAHPRGAEVKLIGRFLPRGLAGLAYWHGLAPFHAWLYRGTLRRLAAEAGAELAQGPEPFAAGPEDACLLAQPGPGEPPPMG